MASAINTTYQTPTKGVTEFGSVLDDYTQRAIIVGIITVVFIAGITGNTLVILAVTLSRRLRSSTNWFIVNLAVTDFITCLFIPVCIVTLSSKREWPLPEWVCAVSAGTTFICVTSSTTNLALIGFNRWYLLTKPLVSFQKTFTRKNLFLMVSCAWLYSLLLVAIPPLAGVGGLGYSFKYKTCTVVNDAQGVEFYGVILGFGMVFLPAIPIVTFYILIFRFVRRHTRKMATHVSMAVATSTEGISEDVSFASHLSVEESEHGSPSSIQIDTPKSAQERPSTERPSTGFSQEQVTITKKLALIVCVFFACFLPIMVCTIVPSDATDPAVPWAEVLVLMNSCVNPMIYARTIPAFREVMGCILRCKYDSIPEPIDFIRRLRSK